MCVHILTPYSPPEDGKERSFPTNSLLPPTPRPSPYIPVGQVSRKITPGVYNPSSQPRFSG